MNRLKICLGIALLPLVLVFGCSTSNNEAGAISFTVIGSGSNFAAGTVDAKILETYSDQAAFDNAVNQYSLQADGEVVDFTAYQVVLVTMGIQYSGGYAIAAERARDVGDYIELNMLFSSPGPNCISTAALTHPFQILKINSLKEVRISERNVVENCG